MKLREAVETLRADIQRHWADGGSLGQNLQMLALTQGIWATAVFRMGQWIYGGLPAPLAAPAKLGYKVAAKAVEITTGISVPASARIGPGFYIGHFGTIIVHPDTRMGRGCSIGQGVTIGTQGAGNQGVPRLGDNVYVGAGAKVLGGISVGDNVAIGANAVVIKDVPADSVAVGVPAVVRPRKPRS